MLGDKAQAQVVQIVDIGLKYEIVRICRKFFELLRCCQLEG